MPFFRDNFPLERYEYILHVSVCRLGLIDKQTLTKILMVVFLAVGAVSVMKNKTIMKDPHDGQ